MIDVELLTFFTVNELRRTSGYKYALSPSEIAQIWENCKSKGFDLQKIHRGPFDCDYRWGSEAYSLAFDFCKYYEVFDKFRSENF